MENIFPIRLIIAFAVLLKMSVQKDVRVVTGGDLKMTKHGDCYEANGAFLMTKLLSQEPDIQLWKLCHGIATGQGEIMGIGHGHCWLEYNEDVVLDLSNGRQIVMRREEYYKIGNIRNVRKYSAEQVRMKILTTGHWGVWI